MFTSAIRLFNVGGFEIKLDPSWFLIAALITWSLATQYFPVALPGLADTNYILLAVLAMLGFFTSLLLHELAHSVVARSYGVRIRGITLFLFGGVAELETEVPSAKVEFRVAIAGPAMSIVLGVLFWMLAGASQAVMISPALPSVLAYLGTVNIVIAVFNMLPAFPMDGGRVLRAYLWARRGDLLSATRTAATSGRILAYGLIALGAYTVFLGAGPSGLWYVLIGFFVLAAARSAYQNQLMQSTFSGKTVSAVMIRDPVVVSPELTLSEFVNQVMLKHRVSFVPVVADGVLIGQIDKDVLSAIDRDHWTNTRVGDVFAGLDVAVTIPSDMAVRALLELISQTGVRKFMVVDDHKLMGVVTLANLIGYLHRADDAIQRKAL
ncbi:Zn-dependent protease [Loktanella sp. PT4BL]|jgi:Zn-dependent protease/CBS domain-containing protein|uniref:site-2 protease family protein n=1 Tax=Loktanella sp. PT4BL TaxID=2135611 RepID=UPI000D751483|nr:site-2 protease family protein [Loktanella sp. PT4BL]PXW72081.1 Zn-dependent protease [Loktanella sp. PT4BL]